MTTEKNLTGGCHCGAVKFTVTTPTPFVAHRCNCSMCKMTGFLHLLVEGDAFTLQQGKADLSHYTFNTGTAQHLFCRHCGVKSFYVPRSNPDGFSVNVLCLHGLEPEDYGIEPFDGENWEQSIQTLDP